MSFSDLIRRLFSYAVKGKCVDGLAKMQRIDKWQGYPHRKFEAIHIAGTNGKGSVALKMAAALSESGRKVGLYTSPHISTFRERIQVGESMIPEEFVEQFLPRLFSFVDEENIQPSFFELLTALAFEYFASQNIEIAVLETGLGGAFDATNVVEPRLSVITSIAYDHIEILGPAIDDIARAKAGIIKDRVPVVIGPQAQFAPIFEAAKGNFIVAPAASGFFDHENNSIARCALEMLGVSESAIQAGLLRRPPCRFEIVDPRPVIFDVAHNPDGFEHLRAALDEKYPGVSFHVILAMGKDKDPAACMKKLNGIASRIACVSNGHARLDDAADVLRKLQMYGFSEAYQAGSLREVLQSPDPLVVTGSFFIMNDARRAIGIQDSVDPCVFTPIRMSESTKKSARPAC